MIDRVPDDRITRYDVRVPDLELAALRARLAAARLPETETVAGAAPGAKRWAQGVPAADLADLLAYWRDGYDWRRVDSPVALLTWIVDKFAEWTEITMTQKAAWPVPR